MKTVKVLYVLVFLIVAAVFALFEYDILPVALIEDTPENRYAVDFVCALTGIGGFFILVTLMKMPIVRDAIHQPDGVMAERAMVRYGSLRLILWAVLMLLDIVLYYEAPMTQNPTYCVLILFVAGVFCWPKSVPTDL